MPRKNATSASQRTSRSSTRQKAASSAQPASQPKVKAGSISEVVEELTDSDDDEVDAAVLALPAVFAPRQSQSQVRANATASGSGLHVATGKENRAGQEAAAVEVESDEEDSSDVEGYDPTFASKPFPFDAAFFAAQADKKQERFNALAGPSNPSKQPSQRPMPSTSATAKRERTESVAAPTTKVAEVAISTKMIPRPKVPFPPRNAPAPGLHTLEQQIATVAAPTTKVAEVAISTKMIPRPKVPFPPRNAPAPGLHTLEQQIATATAQVREVVPNVDRLYLARLLATNLPILGEQTVPFILGTLLEGEGAANVAAEPPALPVAPAPPVTAPAPAPVPLPAPVPVRAPVAPATPEHLLAAATAQILEVIPNVERSYLGRVLQANIPVHGEQTAHLVLAMLIESDAWPKQPVREPTPPVPAIPDAGKGKGRAREEDDEVVPNGAKRVRIDYASMDRPFVGTRQYEECALLALQCDFRYAPKPFLRQQLCMHNMFYAPTHIHLSRIEKTGVVEHKPKVQPFNALRGHMQLNHIMHLDPAFVEEWNWVQGRVGNVDADAPPPDDMAVDAELPIDNGKGKGRAVEAPILADEVSGIECQCCFGDYPFDEMVQCPEAHLFCENCLSSYAGTQLGQQSASLVCMHSSGCALPFPSSELKRVLDDKLFQLYERLVQAAAIAEAGLEGLAECPFCEWKCVWEPAEGDMRFWCGNKDACGKVSCMQCKKEDHRPKSCEDAEKDKHLDGRHTIEEAMTRALMRNCPKCAKAFIKEQGCNKMKCPNCSTLSCYVCRQVITGYEHFHQNQPGVAATAATAAGRCLLWESVEERHANEVRAAAEAARAEYLKHNPDADLAQIAVDVPVAPPPAPARAAAPPAPLPARYPAAAGPGPAAMAAQAQQRAIMAAQAQQQAIMAAQAQQRAIMAQAQPMAREQQRLQKALRARETRLAAAERARVIQLRDAERRRLLFEAERARQAQQQMLDAEMRRRLEAERARQAQQQMFDADMRRGFLEAERARQAEMQRLAQGQAHVQTRAQLLAQVERANRVVQAARDEAMQQARRRRR